MRRRIAAGVMATVVLSGVVATSTMAAGPSTEEITGTTMAERLVAGVRDRLLAHGGIADPAALRVWRVPGGHVVGSQAPGRIETSEVTMTDGSVRTEIRFDVAAPRGGPPASRSREAVAAAVSPSWSWVAQACFARFGNSYAKFDTCYVMRKLVGETDPRDYYQLDHFGTAFPTFFGKLYSAWLEGRKANGSSAMAWVDWSPRGSRTGSCGPIPLSVSALGISVSTSSILCERWDPRKYDEAGRFRNTWSCGCIWPFGQPYPNTREVEYLQAVSVVNGGTVRWTLSAGFHAV